MEQDALFDVVTVLWADFRQELLRCLLLRLQLEVTSRTDREQALALIILKKLIGHYSTLAYKLWWLHIDLVLMIYGRLRHLAVKKLLSELNELLVTVGAGLHSRISFCRL